ncbi:MAG: DUF3368 domain-containing protein [Magnetococcales bacterium]|nr:DUF3368 domain-containing protein [Magnetococcales bacterium]
MDERWVVNASPLILLGRVNHLWLLEKLVHHIAIPQSVLAEVGAGRKQDASSDQTIAWAEQFRIEDTQIPPSVDHWGLGAGESQVIAILLRNGGKGVLDDRMGRRCAMAHGLPVIGTLGVLLLAKRLGVLSSARTLLESLRHKGLFVDDRLIDGILTDLGE